MAIILIVVIIFVVYMLISVCKESEECKKIPKELSDKYIKFISEFNRVNETHYSLYDDLNATFNKCLVDYIFIANYVLPFVPYKNISDITLSNYNYRDVSKYKETNIYKLNECNLQKLIDCQKKQDVKSFYNYLFAIPIKTFSIDYKISAAHYLKINKSPKINIHTVYRDTGEFWSRTFIIQGKNIESKTRDWGFASDYE